MTLAAPRIVNDFSYKDQARESFCLTGAVFGEAQVSLFAAGAVLGVVLCSTE